MNVYEIAEMQAILARDKRYSGHSIVANNHVDPDVPTPAYELIDPDGRDIAIIEYMLNLWKPDECWWLFVPEAVNDESLGMPASWIEAFSTSVSALRYLLGRLAEHRSARK